MPPNRLDLSAGSILHVSGFSSRGHSAKDKFVLVIGQNLDSEALGFLISSQLGYLKQEVYKNEVIRVPHNTTVCLHSERIIQCFALERLSITALYEGFEDGKIENAGKMPLKFLHKLRDVVMESILLAQHDIDDAVKVLPKPK